MARKSRKHPPIGGKNLILTEKKTYNAAIYARLSARTNNDSIQNQIALARQFVAARPSFKLAAIFTDEGASGTNFIRPGFAQMILAVEAGEIDCIVVKDLSRFGRNYIETGCFLENIFPALGLRFVSITDNYDSKNPQNVDNNLSISLKTIIHDVYAKDISRKTAAVIEAKQKRGEFIGNYAAYGYLKSPVDKSKLIVDSETAHIVQSIFCQKIAGQKLVQIAGHLNDAGILPPGKYRRENGITPGGGKICDFWQPQTVKSILSNPVYTGCISQGKRRSRLALGQRERRVPPCGWVNVPGKHEAIIDAETFAAAQS